MYKRQALETATNVDLLLAAVEGSPYKAVLAPFASVGSDGRPDYFAMELALNKYLHSQAEALIKKHYKGKERKELDAMHAFDTAAEHIVCLLYTSKTNPAHGFSWAGF